MNIEPEKQLNETRRQRISEVVQNRQQTIVVLEDLYDPHNAAAIWRSCDAMGIQKVYLVFKEQKPFNPEKVGKKTSATANKWLDFTVFETIEDCCAQLKKDGYTIYGTLLSDQAKSIYDTDFTNHKLAIMFGNEKDGLSATAQSLLDQELIIPMYGMVQSLNISVSAALVLGELTRQRRQGDFSKHQLPKDEQVALIDDFGTRALNKSFYKNFSHKL